MKERHRTKTNRTRQERKMARTRQVRMTKLHRYVVRDVTVLASSVAKLSFFKCIE